MSRPLTREDWNDHTRLQRRDGVPVDECCYFDSIENTGMEPAFAAAGGWARSYFSDGTYQSGRVSEFDIILKPEIEAADNMADAEMAEQQSGEIDWSDVSKLQSRDGVDVLEAVVVHKSKESDCVFYVLADEELIIRSCNKRGEWIEGRRNGVDIIPKPQPKPEPRSVERWIHPGTFSDDGSYLVCASKDARYHHYVKVRITEVVE